MSEWEVFGVITALVAFSAAIVTPIVRLNSNITKLTVTLENITKELEEQKSDNSDSRRRIWNKLDEHSAKISDCEKRLCLTENECKERANGDTKRN